MKITPLDSFSRDDRGYISEYTHERTGQHLIVFSKAGAVRGGHYHKGLSPSKDPEITILLSGTCTFTWRLAGELDSQSAQVVAPARVEVPPGVWHALYADTDTSFIEMNSLDEHVADTFYEE
ncbi:MAG: hypothetical protein EOP49_01185 [Sphingobacteriales bacterium]|nr:MAG: hypothetical protein EOP49_01185 [Sphingobacteriales bacterium]